MPAHGALARAVAILLEDEQSESHITVDMSISLRVCDVDISGTQPEYVTSTDEELLEVGGRWDRRARAWSRDDTDSLVIVRVPRGGEQEVAARWVADWMRRAAVGPRGPHWADFFRVWTLLLEGGRRAGKSWLSLATLVMFAVAVPGSLVWAISPTQDETDELEQGIRNILPIAWYTFRGGGAGKPLQFKLANGSRLLCLSGHKPRSLKRGRVDLALYNEGQNMHRAGWVQLRGAVSDTGGLVIVAANPPDAEIGRWVEEIHEKGRAKKIKAEVFKLTAATNPFCEVQSLEDMADENDDDTYKREVLGEFVPIGDVVMHAWSDSLTVRDVPDNFVDVTAEVTRKEFGRPFGYVVGMDFQAQPHMCAVVYKLFRDPAAGPDGDVLSWAVDEIVVENADENGLVDGLEALSRWTRTGRVEGDGYRGWIADGDDENTPAHCVVVADASGWFQDGAHTKGRTSDTALRARRWTFLHKPQKDSDRNPEVMERVKAANARLKTADKKLPDGQIVVGKRRMFSLRDNLVFNRAMRSWPNSETTGQPDRRSEFAHICDAGTYPIYRLFGRPKLKRSKLEYRSVGKHTRSADLKNW